MNRSRDEVELEKSVRRLRETFHGKIAIDRATLLMRRYSNNHRLVAMEIVLMNDRELDKEDKQCLQTDPVIKNVVQKLQEEEREQAASQNQAPSVKVSYGFIISITLV